ncbi:hypothetical protein TNIN_301491 [Trichonephila inaurata madagascariensis]|uniref:Uncharacterized protein n=1 Tax=Trichonephila inaurata madagascariensis TaxID=2747483 RepID=A0A8X6M8Y6_9ARAC|nr:hypothetical protein TNIN_301491 [Trichonephila inaurata madagascariensis]
MRIDKEDSSSIGRFQYLYFEGSNGSGRGSRGNKSESFSLNPVYYITTAFRCCGQEFSTIVKGRSYTGLVCGCSEYQMFSPPPYP